MIGRIARCTGLLAASCIAAFALQTAAFAAEGEPAPLSLDKAFTAATGKAATDQPAAIRTCGTFPGGGKPGADGWQFDQPVAGGTPLAYVMGFIETVNGAPKPALIGVIAGQVYEVAVNERTMAGQFGPEDLLPPRAGVTGGLTEAGLWLGTPRGWRLASGALLVTGGTAGGAATFALTAVCLPPSASPSPSPSPSPSRSASPQASRSVPPSVSPSASRSPSAAVSPVASPTDTATLPITGGRPGVFALLGLATVTAGLLLLGTLRWRRDRVRFTA
ncbi:hypothetical protein Aph02nite_39030 [Actinoplanes philippinensis]|uniref:LPXTG-motif cell wall anchor domain-containing protein n=1 Tax=Actinoplanes philippinensis TaxID=35752 RepID=A0A1I2GP86_9ACTN|nr:hypothetical protein [Actinoplanes philippinensis]GIE77953.1 hypothetical protein Aph02nite_39030 [Actinoplanes philippinensis]SFF19078.1 hypothetical protein SAMN05421541_10738 [Actinoplanes philippinensis]